jgi:hypothetical protein
MTDHPHYDDPILIGENHPMRLSADALRALKKATGHTMTELVQDDEDDLSRFQVMAFAELYRRYATSGHMPDAATLWERAGAVEIEFGAEALDPTSGESLTDSLPSAATGE